MKRFGAIAFILVAACQKHEATRASGTRALSPPPAPPEVQVQGPKGHDLRVVAATPRGVLTGGQHPTLTFNAPVVSLQTLEEKQPTPADRFTLTPAVKGRWHWLGSSSVEFIADEPVPFSTAFHVAVPAGVTALDGSTLAQPFALDFTTPTVAIQGATPSEALCRWSAREQHFSLVANQPIAEPEKMFFFAAGDAEVPATIVSSVALADERKRADETKQRRRFAALDQPVGYADLRTRYELAPSRPLPANAPFSVTLRAEAHGAQGPLPAGTAFALSCSTAGPMTAEALLRCEGDRHCATGPLLLKFSNPVGSVAELRKRLHITPEVKLDWEDGDADQGARLEDNRTAVALPARFHPGGTYRVHLDAGVPDALGQAAPAFDGEVQFDDLLPSLYVSGEHALLEAAGDGLLPAQVTNLARLHADLWSATPQEMARAELCRDNAGCSYPAKAPTAPLDLALAYPRNEPHVQGVDLRAALAGRKTGFVVGRLGAPGTDFAERPLRVLAQITDLSVHAKLGSTSSIVWVTSVSRGAPVAGAAVSVLDLNGQLASATTDAQGIAQLPGYDAMIGKRRSGEPPQLFVLAALNGDAGYAVTRGYWEDGLPIDVQRDFDTGARGLGLVFAERGIYRPGDLVHLKGLARVLQKGAMRTPAGERVHVQVTDPAGATVESADLVLSRFGTFTLDVEVPAEAKLGGYSVELKGAVPYDGGSFTVAEYRAPQFRVDVVPQAASLLSGEELNASVLARYLFGGAMAEAPAQWSVVRHAEDFAPPANDGFLFGKNTWSWNDEEPAPESGLFASGTGLVGADGVLQVKAGKAEAQRGRAARFTLEAEVTDVSRQAVAGRASVLVHPASLYVGLGAQSGFVKAGGEVKVPVVAAAIDGSRVAAQVHVTALLREWHSIRKRGINGIYETLTEPVETKAAECEVKTGAEPASCALALQKPGFYDLRAEAKDAQGRATLTTISLYAVGAGFAAWQQGDSPKVELVPDKTSYEPGETAHVLVKSPWPKCRALVTVEREGVSSTQVLELTGSASTIDVPIVEEMVPNAFVGVLLVRERVPQGGSEPGDDPGRPAMRIGYAQLKAGTGVKRLSVAVTTPKGEYRPRETVPVDVLVNDSRGAPQAAEVQLYAVDEAVLRLTTYEVPDPIAAMYPQRWLQVATGEALNTLVRKQRFGEKGEIQPGGGGGQGASADVRTRFATTPLWATLTTGADGKAHADLELPDNLTTFRIMAVAATAGDRFGSGKASVQVSLPLLVLPALPRFARLGDELEAGVAVHAQRAAQVTVTAHLSGGLTLAPGEVATKEVSIEAGVAREVRFRMRATAVGKATLRFRASSGALSDGVEQTIPVSLPVEMEAVAVAGDATGSVTEGLTPPKGVRRDVGGLEVTLSSTALGGLAEGMKQLVEYPYGCLEQLSSRLVPFVALREVQRVFGVSAAADDDKASHAAANDRALGFLGDVASDPDAVVMQTIARIEALQQPSGGFLYWPGVSCVSAWPSIYATLALQRAAELGYPVKRETLARARRWLEEKASGTPDCREQRPLDAETRIFALQVLARMGSPRPGYYDELYAQKDELPLFARAQLADAMALGKGNRGRAEALLQDVMDSARQTARDVHFEETDAGSFAPLFSSDTRTTGMVLQTLVDLQPDHPFVTKIARYLTGARKGGAYRNTQEAAYALMGLAEVVRVRERQAPDFVAKVLLGEKPLVEDAFRGRSLDVRTHVVKMAELPASGANLPFVFRADGTGTLFYTALLRYAPEELPKTPRNEGLFVQRWLEPYDQSGRQASEFNAGELVRVRVRVATSQERNYVAVDVPLPAGLEAVDTTLATARQQPREAGEEGQESEQSEQLDQAPAPWFWSPFNYSEKRDDRVVFFADHLPAGVHTESFVARATTPGRFLLKAASAGEMYAPEVFGRTEAGTVAVVAARPLAER